MTKLDKNTSLGFLAWCLSQQPINKLLVVKLPLFLWWDHPVGNYPGETQTQVRTSRLCLFTPQQAYSHRPAPNSPIHWISRIQTFINHLTLSILQELPTDPSLDPSTNSSICFPTFLSFPARKSSCFSLLCYRLFLFLGREDLRHIYSLCPFWFFPSRKVEVGVVCKMKENELLEPDDHFFLSFFNVQFFNTVWWVKKNFYLLFIWLWPVLVAMCWLLSVVLGLNSYPSTHGILVP